MKFTRIPKVQDELDALRKRREEALAELRRRGITNPRPVYFSVPRGPVRGARFDAWA